MWWFLVTIVGEKTVGIKNVRLKDVGRKSKMARIKDVQTSRSLNNASRARM
jgi:hypothetical protein